MNPNLHKTQHLDLFLPELMLFQWVYTVTIPRSLSSVSQGNSASQLDWKFLFRFFPSYSLSYSLSLFWRFKLFTADFLTNLSIDIEPTVMITITISKQQKLTDMRSTKQKHMVRGIAARPSESTGKRTGYESHKAT